MSEAKDEAETRWWRRGSTERENSGDKTPSTESLPKSPGKQLYLKNLHKKERLPVGSAPGATDSRTELAHLDGSIYQHLTCPSCKNIFSQPCVLPCNHSLCKHCLGAIKKKASRDESNLQFAMCPVCNLLHRCEHNGTFNFPENHLLRNIVKRYSQQSKTRSSKKKQGLAFEEFVNCELCLKDKNISERYCKTCMLNYCKKCLKKLHSNPAFQFHMLTKPVNKEEGELACFYHPEKVLTYYCFTDGATICEECMKVNHISHERAEISEAYINRVKSLNAALEQAGRIKDACEADITDVKLFTCRLKCEGVELLRRVTEGFLSLHKKLTEKEEEITEVIEMLLMKSQEEADQFISYSSKHLSFLEGLVQYSQEAQKERNKAVFLQGIDNTVSEIYTVLDEIYQPNKSLKEEPLKNLTVDFESVMDGLSDLYTKYLIFDKNIKKPNVQRTYSAALTAPSITSIGAAAEVVEKEESQNSIQDWPEENNMRVVSSDTGGNSNSEELELLPAGDRSEDKLHLPRPPVIYQHNVKGVSAEIFWMVPLGEQVDTFDVKFQEIVSIRSTNVLPQDQGEMVFGIKMCSFRAGPLKPKAQYLFTVRALNKYGHGKWSCPYWVMTEDADEE
uniref:Tripartite motif containing 42 n=1 Tax=Lepisosteus oculatus TaxID=7918 RepID=W5M9P7_LEPOC|nr:PREDICTED: tripartite motif-containing protein 42 [Lepisosteus oculatus]